MKNINFSRAAKTIFSVLLLGFLATKINYSTLQTLDSGVVGYFLAGLLITTMSLLMMASRWLLLCRQVSIAPGLGELFGFYMQGMFFNIFLPGAIGGDVVRTKKLVDQYPIGLKTGAALTLVERSAGLFGLLALGLSALLVLEDRPGVLAEIPWYVFGLSLVLLLVFVPLFNRLLAQRRGGGIRLTAPVLLLSLIGMLGDITIAWLFSTYFGLQMPYVRFFLIMPVVYVATVLPVSLGGLGVRESTFVTVLSLYGIDPSVAVVIAFLMYLVKVGVGTAGWVIYLRSK